MNADIEWEAKLTIPDEIIKAFDLHEGDTAYFDIRDDSSIAITFSKRKLVDVDIPDDILFDLMKLAHERDITLNQLVEDILLAELTE